MSYNTGDMVTSNGGLSVFSLIAKNTPFQSSAAPENDAPNWTKVMDFPDTNTANYILTGVNLFSSLASSGAMIASAVFSKQAITATAAAGVANNVAAGFEASMTASTAFQQLTQKITANEQLLGRLVDALGDIVKLVGKH